MDIHPFNIHVDESLLADLRRRLESVRLPQSLDVEGWEDGTSVAFMERLIKYWREQFDWRRRKLVSIDCRNSGR